MISGDATICPNEVSDPLLNQILPSGGVGELEYIWLSSKASCPNDLSQVISGADQSAYQPEALAETTYYRRFSRRANCVQESDWMPSNCIVIEAEDTEDCAPANGCSATYSVTGNTININNIVGNIRAVKVLDNNFNVFFSCDDWTTVCNESTKTGQLNFAIFLSRSLSVPVL